jgi:hypothetical protein
MARGSEPCARAQAFANGLDRLADAVAGRLDARALLLG